MDIHFLGHSLWKANKFLKIRGQIKCLKSTFLFEILKECVL